MASVFVLVFAAPGHAATIDLRFENCQKADCETFLVYTAAPGEANDLVIEASSSPAESSSPASYPNRRVIFRDPGADVSFAPVCHRLEDGAVSCLAQTVRAVLGDGNDQASLVGQQAASIDGGAGVDVLTGGGGHDELIGGAGADALYGRGGEDTLREGDPGGGLARSADVYDGEEGTDAVSYRGSRVGVVVDLKRPTQAGQPGEGDRLSGIEEAVGGRARDVLRGDGGPNRLDGEEGPDLIEGREGDDAVIGGIGEDLVSGGAGNDEVFPTSSRTFAPNSFGSARPESNRLLCGTGDDIADGLTTGDLVASDCERARPEGGVEATGSHLPLSSLRAPLLFVVPDCSDGVTCGGATTIAVRVARSRGRLRRGTLLARRTTVLDGSGRVTSGGPVRLSSQGARLVRSYRRIVAEVQVNEGGLPKASTGYLIVLRSPGPSRS